MSGLAQLRRVWLALALSAVLAALGCPGDDDDDATGDDDTADDDVSGDDDATPTDACVDTANLAAVEGTVCALDAACAIHQTDLGIYAGYALDAGLDFDGDGVDDLVSGAPGYDTAENEGRAQLYTADSFAEQVVAPTAFFEGPDPLEFAGYDVALVPDTDGDGRAELLVGARGDTELADGAGAVYLIAGRGLTGTPATPQPLLADTAIHGDTPWGRVGTSVTGLGDATGDGLGELAFGAALFTESSGFEFAADGAIAVFFGRAGGLGASLTPADADLTLTGDLTAGHLGYAIDGRGDCTGDGLADLLVGSPEADVGRGRLYLVPGSTLATLDSGLIDDRALAHSGVDNTGHLGTAVAHVGDLDGDGIGDFAAGVPDSDFAWNDGGKVELLRGSADLDAGTPPQLLAEIGAEWDDFKLGGYGFSSYGSCPSHAAGVVGGDLDGDGLSDLVAGAVWAYLGPVMKGGRAYLFYGRDIASWELMVNAADADAGVVGVAPNDNLTTGMAIGDLDGDGTDDLVLGAPYRDAAGSDSGELYLFWGPLR